MTDAMAIRVAANKSIGILNKVITLRHTWQKLHDKKRSVENEENEEN